MPKYAIIYDNSEEIALDDAFNLETQTLAYGRIMLKSISFYYTQINLANSNIYDNSTPQLRQALAILACGGVALVKKYDDNKITTYDVPVTDWTPYNLYSNKGEHIDFSHKSATIHFD